MDKENELATEHEHFGQIAVKLSQGPLGIIALFIVLTHAFASLVFGFSPNVENSSRSILVWFIVLFPTTVFAVFALLVRFSHKRLYPPGAFRDESIFASTFGHSDFDRKISEGVFATSPVKALEGAPEPRPNKNATGNLYWLGHDLMWIADTLLRQGPNKQVLIGLDQALHHLAHAGLNETPIKAELYTLREQIRFSRRLSPPIRDEYASQIGSIIDRIGATLEAAQGDFQVPPHWNRRRTG